ncbi:hypothetical protein MM213_16095 [Belliella sp. R4-6]|uniref:Uncharacterized protein n=1 Tax=Belliella alkalica TaxID=1730871 RepID=A0ABS9VF09_9BACT|nr:hypothetical protein [Belliella alkalica]MCH7415023.1 hypothetical protein [Belliella alkalica]
MKKIISLCFAIVMISFTFITAQDSIDDGCPPLTPGGPVILGSCIVFQLEIPPGNPIGDPDKSCEVIEEMTVNCTIPVGVD